MNVHTNDYIELKNTIQSCWFERPNRRRSTTEEEDGRRTKRTLS